MKGHAVENLIEGIFYKSEGFSVSIPDEVIGIFN
jgi:hypothetical protein